MKRFYFTPEIYLQSLTFPVEERPQIENYFWMLVVPGSGFSCHHDIYTRLPNCYGKAEYISVSVSMSILIYS